MLVALDVAVFEHDVAKVMAIVANEALAPVVERVAVLAHAGDGFVVAIERVEAKIHAAELDGVVIPVAGPFDSAAAQAVGDVDKPVETEDWIADAELWILGGEAFVEDVALISFAVAVGVAQMDDVRRRCDDDAVFPVQESVGEQQVVREDVAGFKEAIAILVFEDFDASAGRLTLGGAVGIIAHLDDPELAV